MSLQTLMTKVVAKKMKEIPAGWHTAEWFAKRDSISTKRAREILRDLVSAELAEVRSYPTLIGGVSRRVNHYKTT